MTTTLIKIPLLLITHKKNEDVVSFYISKFYENSWDDIFDLYIPNFILQESKCSFKIKFLDNVDDSPRFEKYLVSAIDRLLDIFPCKYIAVSADDFIPTKKLGIAMYRIIQEQNYFGLNYLLLNRRSTNIIFKLRDKLNSIFGRVIAPYPDESNYKASLNVAIWDVHYLRKLLTDGNFDTIWEFERSSDKNKNHFYTLTNNVKTVNFLEKGAYNYGLLDWAKHNGFVEKEKRNELYRTPMLLCYNLLVKLYVYIFGPRKY